MREQLDLFQEGVVYPKGTEIYDTPDPPPVVTYSDLHWYVLNRFAEESARVLRLCGLY